MKRIGKLVGLIAVAAIMGFSFASCYDGGTSSPVVYTSWAHGEWVFSEHIWGHPSSPDVTSITVAANSMQIGDQRVTISLGEIYRSDSLWILIDHGIVGRIDRNPQQLWLEIQTPELPFYPSIWVRP